MSPDEADRIVDSMRGFDVWSDDEEFAEGRIVLDGYFDERALEALLVHMRAQKGVVGGTGIEPVTPSMSTTCSTAELTALKPRRFIPECSVCGEPGCPDHM